MCVDIDIQIAPKLKFVFSKSRKFDVADVNTGEQSYARSFITIDALNLLIRTFFPIREQGKTVPLLPHKHPFPARKHQSAKWPR